MKAAKSFTEILALRGRILLFSPNADVSLRFEQHAERQHAQVICTRGTEDPSVPLRRWHLIHNTREFGMLSCDQHRYVYRIPIPATDIVWIGETGHPDHWPGVWLRFCAAMSRANEYEQSGGLFVRRWTLHEEAL